MRLRSAILTDASALRLVRGSARRNGRAGHKALKASRHATRAAEEARRFTLVNSPLRNDVNRIVRWVGYLIIPVGLLLATMFQLAHCIEMAEFHTAEAPRRGSDFVGHQLRTTVDVHCRTKLGGRALHWLMGGLDFQVEHHLAPRLPHTVYPLVAERLGRACAKQQLTIHSHATPWQAIKSHGRWLKLMGSRPQQRH